MASSPVTKLPALAAALAALLSFSCASAPSGEKTADPGAAAQPKAAGKPGAAQPGARIELPPKPAGAFSTFKDTTYGFQIDFFGEHTRGDTQTQKGPKATVLGYSTTSKDDERVQILNVQIVRFSPGEKSEENRCQNLLPALFKEMAQDRLQCGQVSNLKLLEYHPDGVYSIAGDVPDCMNLPEAHGSISIVCDERSPGQIEILSLAAIGKDPSDPMNRWFLCSLKLRGDVIACPLLAP